MISPLLLHLQPPKTTTSYHALQRIITKMITIANLCLLFSNLRKGRLHYICPVSQSVGRSVGWLVGWCHHQFLLLFNNQNRKSKEQNFHCLLGLVIMIFRNNDNDNHPTPHSPNSQFQFRPQFFPLCYLLKLELGVRLFMFGQYQK